ncbi:hypothetical protein P1P70_43600, partial [Streptomyces sp. MB09-02B]|nr:hypothetical protein [Streptomyces sp. MB09-02B]
MTAPLTTAPNKEPNEEPNGEPNGADPTSSEKPNGASDGRPAGRPGAATSLEKAPDGPRATPPNYKTTRTIHKKNH